MRRKVSPLALVTALLSMCAFALVRPPQAAQPAGNAYSADQMNAQHVQQFFQDVQRKDAYTLNQHILSDAVFVTSNGMESKTDFLNHVKSSNISNVNLADEKVVTPSADVSIVSFRLTENGAIMPGETGTQLVTTVWYRQNGKWMLASMQGTPEGGH